MPHRAGLDAHRLRMLAVEANCDPRTILSVLHGAAVRPMVGARIKRVLLRAGIEPHRRR